MYFLATIFLIGKFSWFQQNFPEVENNINNSELGLYVGLTGCQAFSEAFLHTFNPYQIDVVGIIDSFLHFANE